MSMHKKKILIFADYYLPAFKAGGPVRSLSNLVNLLKDYYEFIIITRDRDFGDKKPYSNITNKMKYDGVTVYYLSPKQQSLFFLFKEIKKIKPDTIYLNSFLSFRFSVCVALLRYFRLINQPLILAPRGELSEGALAIKKVKKYLFISIAKLVNYSRIFTWHATSKTEQSDIVREFSSRETIKFADDLPGFNLFPSSSIEKISGHLKLVYISRVTIKKNLHSAIEHLKNLCGEVIFDIWGPIEDESYWQICQNKITELPKNIQISYRGVLPPEQVWNVFRQYHALYLPTLGENYGHVIVETWQAGRPVLISDTTPWRQLSEKQVGWDVPLSEGNEWQKTLQGLIDMPNELYQIILKKVEYFSRELYKENELLAQYKALFGESDEKK